MTETEYINATELATLRAVFAILNAAAFEDDDIKAARRLLFKAQQRREKAVLEPMAE